jgi:acyl carrier protein
MDAFAASSGKSSGFPWISSSWDPWPEETKKYTGVQTSMDRYTMTPKESVDAFQRVVTMMPDGHVVVATGDLPARLDLWVRREYAADDAASVAHPRPLIQSMYVAPQDERQQQIADIWQQLLGVEQVGINDNFFDLGGHSLLATRMAARLRDAFQIELPLQKFFQSPTVAGLAQAVAAIQAQNEDKQDREKADILAVLANLSDEEAETELLKRLNSTP